MVRQCTRAGQHYVVAALDFLGSDLQFGGELSCQGRRERRVLTTEQVTFAAGKCRGINRCGCQVGEKRLGSQPGKSRPGLSERQVVEETPARFCKAWQETRFSSARGSQVRAAPILRDHVNTPLTGRQHGGGQKDGFLNSGSILLGNGWQPKTGNGMPNEREAGQADFAQEIVHALQTGLGACLRGWRGIAFGAGQVDCKSPVAPSLQFSNQRLPAPRPMPSPVNQQKSHPTNLAKSGAASSTGAQWRLSTQMGWRPSVHRSGLHVS